MLGIVHGPHGHSALDARREDSRRRMWIALAINAVLLGAEVIGGILTGSLAVLADAGHLLSDVGSIVLALIAARLASLPASGQRTFGYQRSEVLAALVNGLLLVVVSAAIAWAAIGRLSDPSSSSAPSASPATSPRPGSWPAASARTSTSRGCCATASPTPSARSASSSPAASSCSAAPTSSTRSSAC
jgi:hypothetical protein